jgi:hypothetical protein
VAAVSVNVNAIVDSRQPKRLAEIDEAARSRGGTVWVTEKASRLETPDEHDALLMAACDSLAGLVPIPVLLPPVGVPGGLKRISQIVDGAQCRVVRLCPVTHRYPLADWILSPIPEICVRHKAALLLDLDSERPPWIELVAFARRFPCLPMVLLATDLERERAASAALDATANLLLQLSVRCPLNSYLLATFGPSRFVYGSGHGYLSELADGSTVLPDADDAEKAALGKTAEALANGTYAERFL